MAVAEVAVVEVRYPVILACWQEKVPFETPCTPCETHGIYPHAHVAHCIILHLTRGLI